MDITDTFNEEAIQETGATLTDEQHKELQDYLADVLDESLPKGENGQLLADYEMVRDVFTQLGLFAFMAGRAHQILVSPSDPLAGVSRETLYKIIEYLATEE